MHVYEYLFAGLIIIAMLVGSAYMMTTLSSPAGNASDKNQLKITTEKIMTQMLLDSGYPYNWGRTGEVPQVFGLARSGQTSRQAYELDPDKVMRLNISTTDLVPTSLAVSLLNLANEHGVAEYGFSLEFTEPLLVDVTPSGSDETYTISVKSDYTLPVIGAKVSATLYYINATVAPPRIDHKATPTPYPLTDYEGSCTFTFGTLIETAKVLAITIDYYGTHVTKLQVPLGSPGLNATLFQNKLVPDPSQPYNVGSGADAREIVLTHNDNGYETNDFAVQNIGTSTGFVLKVPPEPSAVAVLAISGNKLLLADRDFSQIKYSTFKDPNTKPPSFAYSVERAAIIGGSTYTATLYLWRMSI